MVFSRQGGSPSFTRLPLRSLRSPWCLTIDKCSLLSIPSGLVRRSTGPSLTTWLSAILTSYALAHRANMRRSSGGLDADDQGATFSALLAFAAVDPMESLKRAGLTVAAAVVQQRRAVVANGLVQGGLDSAQKTTRLCGIQAVGMTKRMDAGRKERLVAVDVAQPGDDPLVHEQGLDLPSALENSAEGRGRDFQRFGTEQAKDVSAARTARSLRARASYARGLFHAVDQEPHAAESPRVAKTQLGRRARHGDAKMGMGFECV